MAEEAVQAADTLRRTGTISAQREILSDSSDDEAAPVNPRAAAAAKKKKSGKETLRARARRKVERTALMHNGGRDSAQLIAFQGSGLKGKEFGKQWNKAFPCNKLSSKEAKAVLPFFDGDGSGDIDGAEFLVKFFDLSQRMKRGQRTQHRERSSQLETKRLLEVGAEARKEEARMAQEMKVDFTTQDKKEALAKLKKAALEYKTRYTPRSLGGMAGLSGFDGTKIPPTILRSMLAKTFDLNLSRRETGALIVAVQGYGSLTVDGSNFVRFFHNLGTKACKQQKQRILVTREWNQLVEEAAAQKREEQEDFEIVDGGIGAYHPLDLNSAYAKLGSRATMQVRSRPKTRQFLEGGPLNPRDFRRRVRSEFDVNLSERELSAVVASLQTGGNDADAERIDGQRFLKRMSMLNSTAKRLPRVVKAPMLNDWTDNKRYNARPITAGRYTNPDLCSPKHVFQQFTAFDPCGVDRDTLLRVTGRVPTPSPVKKRDPRKRLGMYG